jgi:hypothetical protein
VPERIDKRGAARGISPALLGLFLASRKSRERHVLMLEGQALFLRPRRRNRVLVAVRLGSALRRGSRRGAVSTHPLGPQLIRSTYRSRTRLILCSDLRLQLYQRNGRSTLPLRPRLAPALPKDICLAQSTMMSPGGADFLSKSTLRTFVQYPQQGTLTLTFACKA